MLRLVREHRRMHRVMASEETDTTVLLYFSCYLQERATGSAQEICIIMLTRFVTCIIVLHPSARHGYDHLRHPSRPLQALASHFRDARRLAHACRRRGWRVETCPHAQPQFL